MKSKFNLIALSFLMATTLSSATFASAEEFDVEKETEKKSSAPSYKVRAVKALTEAAVVGGTVRLFMYGADEFMRDNDPEQLRFQAGTAVVGFTAIRSLFPAEMTATEILKALPKFGIKAGFTLGGAFLATSYYETLKAFQGSSSVDFEAERQERMNYTAYGAMVGNLTGNVVNTTLDGISWGVKSIFKSMWGDSKSLDADTAEAERLATERRLAAEAEEEERLATERRLAAEEEARQAAAVLRAQQQDKEELDDILAEVEMLKGDALNAQQTSNQALTSIATSTVAQAKSKHPFEVQWDGVLDTSEQNVQTRTKLKTEARLGEAEALAGHNDVDWNDVLDTSEETSKVRVAKSSKKSKQGYTGASTSSSSDY